jgi:hypothetical protein
MYALDDVFEGLFSFGFHHRCPHPKGSELLPEPHRAVVAEVAARLPSNAVAWGR